MKFIKFNSTVEPIDHKTKLYIYIHIVKPIGTNIGNEKK